MKINKIKNNNKIKIRIEINQSIDDFIHGQISLWIACARVNNVNANVM